MNSNRKWILFLSILAVVVVTIYFGGDALWQMFLKMHGAGGH